MGDKNVFKGTLYLTILIVLIILSGYLYYIYMTPIIIDIEHTYKGIRYQANNLEYSAPIELKVKGTYKKSYFKSPTIFEGDIIIDGIIYHPSFGEYYSFNEYMMTNIVGDDFMGFIFISDEFKEITIEVLEKDSPNTRSFSFENGWLISAPAENREEAVRISNRLIQKLHKNVILK